MIVGAKLLLKQLEQFKVLEKAFEKYPHYSLTLTGDKIKNKIFIEIELTLNF